MSRDEVARTEVGRMTDTARRRALAACGCLCVGLGAVGVFVPGMPTTVFLLAASYLFARSSPRLERALMDHPRLGPYLRRHAETGGMTRRSKGAAVVSMWCGIGLSLLLLAGAGALVRLVIVLLGMTGTLVIAFFVRTVSPAPAASSEVRTAVAR